ncbi:MAG: transglutaminase-like domain-containing protein [Coriobacteriales bacterium]|jgi:hypothetical protein|nr:transglutaminase-like domain-containing protein [Coriobacteriales bacterium]
MLIALLLVVLLAALLLAACGANGARFGDNDSGNSSGSDTGPGANVAAGSADPAPARDATPEVLEVSQPAQSLAQDNTAALDYSNASEGYVCARSLAADVKIKALVHAPDGSQYQYTLATDGSWITIPLSAGNGSYAIELYENIYADQYAALFSQIVEAQLTDEFKPFLYPNQFVDFAAGDDTVLLSQQLASGASGEVEAVDQIYNWVVENISYDYNKAANVAPGYLPDNSATLTSKTGICFDYAVLTASMLRAQRLPCKLDIGYAGQGAYHAWIHVYTRESGWITRRIDFPGDSWVLMDPTFDSTSGTRTSVVSYVGDGTSYQTLFNY